MEINLKEKYMTLLNLRRKMHLEYEKCPKGEIYVAHTKGHIYYYLEEKEDNRILSVYINGKDILSLSNQIERRHELNQKLNELDTQLRRIKRYV